MCSRGWWQRAERAALHVQGQLDAVHTALGMVMSKLRETRSRHSYSGSRPRQSGSTKLEGDW